MKVVEKMDIKDVHYGWNIGTFYVSGFTDKKGSEDDLVILKNCGDTVTLWFNLEQDINKLNKNDKLSVCDDKDGYDQNYFSTNLSNFS